MVQYTLYASTIIVINDKKHTEQKFSYFILFTSVCVMYAPMIIIIIIIVGFYCWVTGFKFL